ncbi:MAG: hypothetical protein AAGD00_01555 [Planctomycetota bacterium]
MLKWFVRTVGVLALVLVIATSWAMWRTFGPLPPLPDYHAELVALAESRLVEQQAWSGNHDRVQILDDIIERLNIELQLAEGGEPDFSGFVERPDEARASTVLDALQESGAIELVDSLEFAPPCVRTLDSAVPLIGSLYPDFGRARVVNAAFVFEMGEAIRAGDEQRATAALRRSLLVASTFENTTSLIEFLVGGALRSQVIETLRAAVQRGDTDEAGLIRALTRDFEAYVPNFELELAIAGERLMLKDTAGRLYRRDPELQWLFDDDEYLGLRPSLHRLIASEREIIATFDRVFDSYVHMAELPMYRQVRALHRFDERFDEFELFSMRLGLVSILTPAVGNVIRRSNEQAIQIDATRLVLAIERFRLEHDGRLPTSLEELVPDYLSRLPQDPMCPDGRAYGFRAIDPGEDAVWSAPQVDAPERGLATGYESTVPRTYLLWSIGVDGEDNGGTRYLGASWSSMDPANDRAVGTDYILNMPPFLPEDEQEQ